MGTTYRGKRTSSRQSRSNRLFTLGIGAAVCLLLVTYVPAFSLWLPGMFK